jgi:hypothetical protein
MVSNNKKKIFQPKARFVRLELHQHHAICPARDRTDNNQQQKKQKTVNAFSLNIACSRKHTNPSVGPFLLPYLSQLATD